MTIWKIFSFLILAVPAATFILGLICWRYPPQGPTWALGYRSRRARASDASWLEAQSIAGRIWFCLGLLLVVIGLPVCSSLRDLPVESMTGKAIRFILTQDLLLALSLIPTEVLLWRKYDRFGRLRRRAKLQPAEDFEEAPMSPVPETEEEFEPLDEETDLVPQETEM